jgi:hypothetical protein
MSEEDFLSRWSRRKREADESAKESAAPSAPLQGQQPDPAASPAPEASNAPDAGNNPEKKPEEEFDLSTLPSIDSITAATDVTAFLRKGVPLELTRAALRRAWVADPAIRDFVGLAENAWDFNDPNAMPGFGPLDQTPEQVRELVAKIVGGARRADDVASASEPPPTLEPAKDSNALPNQHAAGLAPPQSDAAAVPAGNANDIVSTERVAASARDDAASQNKQENAVKLARSHGGALPR